MAYTAFTATSQAAMAISGLAKDSGHALEHAPMREFSLEVWCDLFETVNVTAYAHSLNNLVKNILVAVKMNIDVGFVEVYDHDFQEWVRVLSLEDVEQLANIKLHPRVRTNTLKEFRTVLQDSDSFKHVVNEIEKACFPSGLGDVVVESMVSVVNPELEKRFSEFCKESRHPVERRLYPCNDEQAKNIVQSGFELPVDRETGPLSSMIKFEGNCVVKVNRSNAVHKWIMCDVAAGAVLDVGNVHADMASWDSLVGQGYDSITNTDDRDVSKCRTADLYVLTPSSIMPRFLVTLRAGDSKYATGSPTKSPLKGRDLRTGDPVRFCGEHSGKELDVYCSQCSQVICAHCSLVGEHKGHPTIILRDNIENLYTKSVPQAQGCLEGLPPRYQALDKAEKLWEARLHEVESNRDARKKEIGSAFSELKMELLTRQLMLVRELERQAEAEKQRLLGIAKDFRLRGAALHRAAEILEHSKCLKPPDVKGMLIAASFLTFETTLGEATMPESENVFRQFDKNASQHSVSVIKGISFAAAHQVFPSNEQVMQGNFIFISGRGFSNKKEANYVTIEQKGKSFPITSVVSSNKTQIVIDAPLGLGEGSFAASVTVNGASSGQPVRIGSFIHYRPQPVIPRVNGLEAHGDGVTYSATDPAMLSAFTGETVYSSGQHYWEVEIRTLGSQLVGVAIPDCNLLDPYGARGCWFFQSQKEGNSWVWNNGNHAPFGKSVRVNDHVGILLDLEASTVELFLNKESMGVAFDWEGESPPKIVAAVVMYPGGEVRMNWRATCPRPLVTPRTVLKMNMAAQAKERAAKKDAAAPTSAKAKKGWGALRKNAANLK